MSLDDYKFRAITYQGVTFPATLMGISILEPLPDIKDENLAEWLWRLTICCGFTKRAPAEKCVKCARQAADLMLEHRQGLLDGIRNRLAPHGLETETTYSAWLLSLQRIVELSSTSDGECTWSAPSHPRDALKSEAEVKRFIDKLR